MFCLIYFARKGLTDCGLVVQYGVLVNTGSDNGFLPDWSKPIPELMLTYYQHSFQSNVLLNIQKISIPKCLKFIDLKWQSHFPGNNELRGKNETLFKLLQYISEIRA